MQRSTQAFVLLALLAGACTPTLTARRVKKQEDVRFRGKEDDEIAVYSPRSKLFRIAVVDFVDQTHNTAGKVAIRHWDGFSGGSGRRLGRLKVNQPSSSLIISQPSNPRRASTWA